MITATEARISAFENDFAHIHHRRTSMRMGEQYKQLRLEREKAAPDPKRIEALKKAMIQTERDKSDTSITELEVLEPLRRSPAEEAAATPGSARRIAIVEFRIFRMIAAPIVATEQAREHSRHWHTR